VYILEQYRKFRTAFEEAYRREFTENERAGLRRAIRVVDD
jgi:hypothetical protein